MPFALKPQWPKRENLDPPGRDARSWYETAVGVFKDNFRIRLHEASKKKQKKEVDDIKLLNEHCWERISDKKLNESN